MTGDKDEALVDASSGVEPMLSKFMALAFEGVGKVLEAELLWPWKAEKL